jgi:RNA-binding protein
MVSLYYVVMIELSSRQRKILEKHAQQLSPSVLIGQAGVSDQSVAQIDLMLKSRELIKIKFNEFKEEKRELSERISLSCHASLVRIIGHVAIFYRPAEQSDKRLYEKELSAL